MTHTTAYTEEERHETRGELTNSTPESPQIAMLAWGQAADGRLGLGGVEEPLFSAPQRNKHIGNRAVKGVACGRSHTVILLDDGGVLSCGSNDVGQLGQDEATTRPARITSLDTLKISHVCCGHAHSLALTDQGQLYSWGEDTHGQLGLGSSKMTPKFAPKHVKALAKHTVVQVQCGAHHSLALLQGGVVFSWGSNNHGQLAHSAGQVCSSTPLAVVALEGLPVVQIATGGDHSFVVSVSGAVYGWGRNNSGQLGIGDQKDTIEPVELTTLRSHKVKFIACGDEHTAALTEDGGVFTFGAGGYGQLGHNSTHSSTTYPTKVFELMGTTVCQIACGRCHTLVLVKSSGRVFSFGLGGSGQLGNSTTTNIKTPVPVAGAWLPSIYLKEPMESSVDTGSPVDKGYVVRRIFAGGDQSFASVWSSESENPPRSLDVYDCRVISTSHAPFFLRFERVKQLLDIALITKNTAEVIRALELVFLHSSCLNGSFLSSDHFKTSEKHSGVDIASARQTFTLLRERLKATETDSRLLRSLHSSLLPALPSSPFSLECARLYFLLPAYVMEPFVMEAVVPYLRAFLQLDPRTKTVIGNWVFSGPQDYLHLLINTLMTAITSIMMQSKEMVEDQSKNRIDVIPHKVALSHTEQDLMQYGLQFLKHINDWNNRHGEVVPYHQFHLKAVSEVVDLFRDYFHWMEEKPNVIVFCHYPFVLDAQAKAELMMVDARLQMHLAVTKAQRQNVQSLLTQQMIRDFSPFAFELEVRRERLIHDTLRHLITTEASNYKKPLRVQFVGEEGVDAGGVQKEFFMLLLREILNPDFGMFVEDDESHLVWFRDQALMDDNLDYFILIGILCGLAIYNSVIIDLPFPTALYKKLLKRPTDLSDLRELRPSMAANLQELLDYEENNFQESFHLSFEVLRSNFGAVESIELIPGGSKIPVTKDTRQDYVNAYVKYVMTDSVKEPFEAFASGFFRVCGGKVLDFFHPKELMILVIGNQVVDWTELEKYVDYKNGYSPNDPTIRIFWKVFFDLPLEGKKKFLVFLTGSNRIPVAGVKSMKVIIQRMDGGPGCQRLPVAHTCFNVLDLPPYRSEAVMKEKLLQAINFTAGFGII